MPRRTLGTMGDVQRQAEAIVTWLACRPEHDLTVSLADPPVAVLTYRDAVVWTGSGANAADLLDQVVERLGIGTAVAA